MNKWNTLLTMLDKVFGHEGKNKSSFKPIKKYFNQETGDMITIIEYRTKKPGETVIKNGNKNKSRQRQGLLQALLQQKKTKNK